MRMQNMDNGERRHYMNHEVSGFIEGEDIAKVMRAHRISWLGHIMRRGEGQRMERQEKNHRKKWNK